MFAARSHITTGGASLATLPTVGLEATNVGALCLVSFSLRAIGTFDSTKTAAATWLFGPAAGDWFRPVQTVTPGVQSNHWVRATVIAGSLSGGTTGVWTQLNTDQTWDRDRPTVGTSTVTLQLEISTNAAGTNIISSGNVTFSATRV